MSTARVLIADALDCLEIKSPQVTLTDSEIGTGIRYMNRLMASWAEDGLNVGYHFIEDVDQETEIPIWFEACLIAHLAIMLAPSYGVAIDARRLATAKEMLDIVEKRLVNLGPVRYPDTLPVGAGNSYYDSNYFFQRENPDLLSTSSNQNLDDDEEIDLST